MKASKISTDRWISWSLASNCKVLAEAQVGHLMLLSVELNQKDEDSITQRSPGRKHLVEKRLRNFHSLDLTSFRCFERALSVIYIMEVPRALLKASCTFSFLPTFVLVCETNSVPEITVMQLFNFFMKMSTAAVLIQWISSTSSSHTVHKDATLISYR